MASDNPEYPTQTTQDHRLEDHQVEGRISYLNLPKKGQLLVLCFVRMAEPLAQTSIESYLFYQLRFFDGSAPDATISSQAGILIGARTMAHVCTGILWGRLADSERGGRKAVLLIGLASSSYGLSTKFITALGWQVMGGALSNNIAVTRCVVSELNSDKGHRARALILLPLFASAGHFVGPLVGGVLSSNNKSITAGPGRLPFLAPNLVVAAIYLLAAIMVFLFLEETLEQSGRSTTSGPSWKWRRLAGTFSFNKTKRATYSAVDQDERLPTSPGLDRTGIAVKVRRRVRFDQIWTFNVKLTMVSQFIIAGHVGTFPILLAIFLSTPPGDSRVHEGPFEFNGGLGLLPREVGFVMSFLGAFGILLQLAVYPALQDRFGTISIWRKALLVFPITYLAAPYPSFIASRTADVAGQVSVLAWLSIGSVVCSFVVGKSGVTPATTMLINDSTPHPSVRGTIHAAATVTSNLSRSIFPVLALTIFGHGLRIGIVGLGFWALSGLAFVSYSISLWVREGANGGEIFLDDSDDEQEETPAPGSSN